MDDKILEEELEQLCRDNEYEFVKWYNEESSVLNQMKMYSESEIVIGVQGSDWANSFWTSENQLLLEIVPSSTPEGCDSCEQYPFDFSVYFYSEHLQDQVKAMRLHEWWRFNENQKRNWQNVIAEEPCETIKLGYGRGGIMKPYFSTFEVKLSKSNREQVIEKVQNHLTR